MNESNDNWMIYIKGTLIEIFLRYIERRSDSTYAFGFNPSSLFRNQELTQLKINFTQNTIFEIATFNGSHSQLIKHMQYLLEEHARISKNYGKNHFNLLNEKFEIGKYSFRKYIYTIISHPNNIEANQSKNISLLAHYFHEAIYHLKNVPKDPVKIPRDHFIQLYKLVEYCSDKAQQVNLMGREDEEKEAGHTGYRP